LRFRIRRGNFEVELEGEFDYVQGKFEELMQSQPVAAGGMQALGEQPGQAFAPGEELAGIL